VLLDNEDNKLLEAPFTMVADTQGGEDEPAGKDGAVFLSGCDDSNFGGPCLSPKVCVEHFRYPNGGKCVPPCDQKMAIFGCQRRSDGDPICACPSGQKCGGAGCML
jgi:hypothetical protein